MLSFLKDALQKIYKYKDPYCIVLLIGAACAFANLFWIDSLMNLKYIYILLALFVCRDCYHEPLVAPDKKESKANSKYIKKSVL